MLVTQRETGVDKWIVQAPTADETLSIPETGIEIRVAAFYEDVEFEGTPPDADA